MTAKAKIHQLLWLAVVHSFRTNCIVTKVGRTFCRWSSCHLLSRVPNGDRGRKHTDIIFSSVLVTVDDVVIGLLCGSACAPTAHRSNTSGTHWLIVHDFYRAIHFSAKRGIEIARRLSVCLFLCPSVTLVDQDHIGWKSWKWKLIARTISNSSQLSSH